MKTHRVLCVDDHEQLALLVKRLLERAGHECECVSDGQQAWDRLSADPGSFGVVVVDHQMPGLSGLDLTVKLRAAEFPGLIIVQSCRLTPQEENAFRAQSVHQILCKPRDIFRLVEIVGRAQ